MTRSEILLDTAFAIALLNTTDAHHATAIALAQQLRRRARLILTRAICLEIGNAMCGLRLRELAAEFLVSLEDDPDIEIIPWNERIYSAAVALFQNRPDKSWSLTDCVSFVVMRERGITDALTSDRHFQQAGFRPLLRTANN
jgi:hypothetical protein